LKLKNAENKKMKTSIAKIPSIIMIIPIANGKVWRNFKDLRKTAAGKRIIVFTVPVVQDFLRIERKESAAIVRRNKEDLQSKRY
jgi:hypothetical protein